MSEQFVIIANIAGPVTQEGQTREKDGGKSYIYSECTHHGTCGEYDDGIPSTTTNTSIQPVE